MLFENTNITGIISRFHIAFDQFGEIEKDDYVYSTPRRKGAQDVLDLNFQAGLFQHFASGRFFRTLTRFNKSARQTPVVDERLTTATHQNEPAIGWNYRGCNRLGIVPVHELTAHASNPISPADGKHLQIFRTMWTTLQRERYQSLGYERILPGSKSHISFY